MQNRYIADIGDYVKFSLLRTLSEKRSLGVAWYLFPCEDHNDDGRHIKYLEQPEEWRSLDPELFDGLRDFVQKGERSIQAIEGSDLLPETTFSSQLLETDAEKATWRKQWFQNVLTELEACDLVFAAPDNGICMDDNFHISRQKSWKRMPLSEVINFAKGRPAVVYHHNSRFPGGHYKEIDFWMEELPGCRMAFYFKRFSNRTFFVLNATPDIEDRLRVFSQVWSRHGELIHAKRALFAAS